MKKRIELVVAGTVSEVENIENRFADLTHNENVLSYAAKEIN